MTLTLDRLPQIDYAAHPAYGGMFQPDPQARERALELLQPMIEWMTEIETQRVDKFGYRYGYVDEPGKALVNDSVTVNRLPKAAIDQIERLAKPYVEPMRARLDEAKAAKAHINFKMVNHVLSEDRDWELWDAVDEAMREMNVYEQVKAFFGAPIATLNSLAVFVNPANQNWIAQVFRDFDLDTPPTNGMHIDSNGKCYLKSILYLNDVGPEQGPTCIVPGSHEWESGSVDRIRRRAYDRSKLLGRTAKDRLNFYSLPPELQLKAEFGGDLLPDSDISKALLEHERACTGERGTYSMFNPEAVHRGGDVKAGERHALQITLTARF